MNPGSILDRGYSILQNKNKQVITSVKMTVPAETLSARMSDGSIQLRVLDDKKKPRKN
jgi:exonuclease VII large subunit